MTAAAKNLQWDKVLKRDKSADGSFVYAVRSTRVYCRPSCPSRRPNFDQVEFFESGMSAQKMGYRSCLRCKPDQTEGNRDQIELVKRICQFIQKADEPPSLAELSSEFNLSSYHLQRTFKKIAGISPHQYADEIRFGRLKNELKKGSPVTEALYEAGYASSSTLYEHAADRLGMTPARYKSGASQLMISYTTTLCPLGWLLIAHTAKGICALSLGDSDKEMVAWLEAEFPNANINKDSKDSEGYAAHVLSYLLGEQPHCDLPLDVKATAFQRMVWEELKRIPYGTVRTYGQVADAIGQPSAVRAVARACATNPVALVVPCHRVVRKTGNLAGYRWGMERKKALLELENGKKLMRTL